MQNNLRLRQVLSESLKGAVFVIAPSLVWLLVFSIAGGVLAWSAAALPDTPTGTVVFLILALIALYAHNLFSAAMYRALLPSKGSLSSGALKLIYAWLLVMMVTAIILSMLVLFFTMVGASFGIVSGGGDPANTTDVVQQMREGGTFWPFFGLLLLALIGLFWFAVRLMTFAAATVTRNQVHIFQTWAWSKGYFLVLGPGMLILIALPLFGLGLLAHAVNTLIFGEEMTAIKAGLATFLALLITAPSAWLGHAFAAHVYRKISPTRDAV